MKQKVNNLKNVKYLRGTEDLNKMPITWFLTTYKFKNLLPFIDLTHNSILKLSRSSDLWFKKSKKQITDGIIMKYSKLLAKSLLRYTNK